MANTTTTAAKVAAKEDAPAKTPGKAGRPKLTPEQAAARRIERMNAQLPRLQRYTDKLTGQIDAYRVRLSRMKALPRPVLLASANTVIASAAECRAVAETVGAKTNQVRSRVDLTAVANQAGQ